MLDAVVYCYLVTDNVWIYRRRFVHHVKQEDFFSL